MKTLKIAQIAGILLLSIPLLCVAQEDQREELTFGLKAGGNISNVWDEQGEDFTAEAKFGFVGGAFFGIPIGKYIGVQPEVLISQKGFQGKGTLLGSTYSFSRRSTYLDIPIQLQLKTSEFLYLIAGPQYSYLISQRDKFTFGENSTIHEEDFENDNIRKNILGFVAGLDAHIDRMTLSGRLGWDLQRNNGDGTSEVPRYKNRWIQFTVGFRI